MRLVIFTSSDKVNGVEYHKGDILRVSSSIYADLHVKGTAKLHTETEKVKATKKPKKEK
ncbi:hypothetical protein TPMD03_65 [Thiohalocapsa phage LS06-2018-MD03]|nr:hypothetical protein TPMD03_65 [Thiohalocapsa phage LS06-2018-MD03]